MTQELIMVSRFGIREVLWVSLVRGFISVVLVGFCVVGDFFDI
jgi:hypothetical protein